MKLRGLGDEGVRTRARIYGCHRPLTYFIQTPLHATQQELA